MNEVHREAGRHRREQTAASLGYTRVGSKLSGLRMWWSWHSSLLCATLIHQALALHESDVGVIDWHKPLIGLPNPQDPLTLPSFHRVRDERTQLTNSVVITGTRSNVLAGVDPMNGSLSRSSYVCFC